MRVMLISKGDSCPTILRKFTAYSKLRLFFKPLQFHLERPICWNSSASWRVTSRWRCPSASGEQIRWRPPKHLLLPWHLIGWVA